MSEHSANGAKRDARLDIVRGLANWAIFVDHVPNNVVAWLTTRNYGFSDAADLFVFISGYTATLVYSKYMQTRGFAAGASMLFGRIWQIYVAHVLLFVAYMASIGYVAQAFDHSHLLDEFNVRLLIQDPIETLKHGLLLEFKPMNLDVLPLYIALMAMFVPVVWLMPRFPNLMMLTSLTLYILSRMLGWNLPAYPNGTWYFNPFAWQLLFMIGGWIAIGGASRFWPLVNSNAVLLLSIGYLGVSLVLAMAVKFPLLGVHLPDVLMGLAHHNKTNLDPQRIVHFLALALVVVRFLPQDAPVLHAAWLWPLKVCGQRSLEVFCVGAFLAFVAHFLIELVSNTTPFQILVSIGGFAIMTAIAAYRTWSKDQQAGRSNPSGLPA